MLTQCPNCQTTFRVTSEILRVAEGQVRCGRCQTQFNALERLIDEGAPVGDVETGRFLRPPRVAARQPEPAIEVEEPDEQEDIQVESRRIDGSGTYRVPERADAMEEPGRGREFSEEWVEIDDLEADAEEDDAVVATGPQAEDDFGQLSNEVHTSGEDVDPDEDYDEQPYPRTEESNGIVDDPYAEDVYETRARDVPISKVEDVIARAAAAAAALRASPPKDPLFALPSRRVAAVARSSSGPSISAADDELDLLNAKARTARKTLHAGLMKWKWLTAPLVLLLVIQVIHHFRSDLARHPQIGAPLMDLYRTLNLPLTPEWELHAYDVKQWGVLSDPAAPGTLKVRASITNRAEFAQPYPLLKLVLEDRWGDQVRAREFEPTEYLDPGVAANRLLGPQQQANATINIVDPGPDAEGFRFDVCLRGRAGPVCAADIPE